MVMHGGVDRGHGVAPLQHGLVRAHLVRVRDRVRVRVGVGVGVGVRVRFGVGVQVHCWG